MHAQQSRAKQGKFVGLAYRGEGGYEVQDR